MTDKERPAEPVVDDDGTADRGGFAKAAEHLNKLYPTRPRPISRQLVHKWWHYRHFNDFPEAVQTTGTANGGKGRSVFDLTEVENWYASYLRHRGVHSTASQEQTQRITGTEPSTDDKGTLAA
jgi:hypothetical protein